MKEKIRALLPADHPWKNFVLWFDAIDSTNTRAKLMAQEGAPHGTVLIADRQTGGRGRMGRSFCSPAGQGIYLSVILRPRCKAEHLMHLTCATAVAMCDAIQEVTGFCPGVKWINDLVAKGKKLGGILTELSICPSDTEVDFAVIGIGINCNQVETDFPLELQDIAISLKTITGKDISRAQLAAAMIRHLYEMDLSLLTDKPGIMARYKRHCVTLGQDIYLLRGEEKTACVALDLDPEGGLLVGYPDGSREVVQSGEVSVRNRQ